MLNAEPHYIAEDDVMKINFAHHGNFNRFESFLTKLLRIKPLIKAILHKYGKRGVNALKEATPKLSGKTAESWTYDIEEENGVMKIVWKNSNVNDGHIIALLLQYGHGTRQGGYVEGTDYINPAIAEIFGQMANEAWKEVTSL